MGSEASRGDVEPRIVLHEALRSYLGTLKTVIHSKLVKEKKSEDVLRGGPSKMKSTLPGQSFFILASCSDFGIQIRMFCHPCTVDK